MSGRKRAWSRSRRGRPMSALEIFDPLVSHFLQKSDEDKAIGLLGLILMSGTHASSDARAADRRFPRRGPDKGSGNRPPVAASSNSGTPAGKTTGSASFVSFTCSFPWIPTSPGKPRRWASRRSSAGRRTQRREAVATEEDREMIRLNLAKDRALPGTGPDQERPPDLENLRLLYPDEPRIQRKYEEIRNAETGV